MCEHCNHLQLTRVEKKLDLLLNLEGYEIDDYGLPVPSKELLEEQKEEEGGVEDQTEEYDDIEPEKGLKVSKKVVEDD